MQVFEISATFARSRQPRDYETARAELSAKAVVEDHEDWTGVVEGVLNGLQHQVYIALGMQKQAERVCEAAGSAPAEQTSTAGEQQPAQSGGRGRLTAKKRAEQLGLDYEALKAEVAGSGKGGRLTVDDVEAAAAKQNATPAEPEQSGGQGSDEIDAALGGEKSEEPEPAAEEPEQDETAEEVTDRDLQSLAAELSRSGKAQAVKELMKQYGVARLGEMPQEKRAVFVAEAKAL